MLGFSSCETSLVSPSSFQYPFGDLDMAAAFWACLAEVGGRYIRRALQNV